MRDAHLQRALGSLMRRTDMAEQILVRRDEQHITDETVPPSVRRPSEKLRNHWSPTSSFPQSSLMKKVACMADKALVSMHRSTMIPTEASSRGVPNRKQPPMPPLLFR